MSVKKTLDPSEHQHQAALFKWAELAKATHPELAMLAAVPNGGHRHIAVAAKLKAEGVKAGYPDIVLDVARYPYHGLRIELKPAKSGRLSPQQKEWIEQLSQRGYQAVVCKGWEDAKATIEAYLALHPWPRGCLDVGYSRHRGGQPNRSMWSAAIALEAAANDLRQASLSAVAGQSSADSARQTLDSASDLIYEIDLMLTNELQKAA